ncbi:MAG: rhodanese-like domain-containing protein [bacterium]
MNRIHVMLIVLVVFGLAVAAAGAQSDAQSQEDLDVFLDPDRLLELIEDPPEDFYLVDVRTEREYRTGHVPGAILIPYGEIAENPPTDDRDALIVVYCRTGGRSARADDSLRDAGYTRVLDWGGIVDWPHRTVSGSSPR